nr:DUF2459 domain-containing protein [Neoroseomonas alba]
MVGACTTPEPAPVPLSGESVTVSAESWHTDLCLAANTLSAGPLAPLVPAAPMADAFGLGFGLESWMRADRPGSAEALSALSGGPAVVSIRALAGPLPPGSEEAVTLRLPSGGQAAIAAFVADQLTEPLIVQPGGGWTLLRSRLRYSPDFTCNTWVLQALATAGLPVPAAGIRLRGVTMAALRRELLRQG